MQEDHYLKSTRLLDYNHSDLRDLVDQRQWRELDTFDRIGAVYRFVKDEIRFGFNESDDIPASRVLRDGYGQCNTKTTLLVALLRGVGVSCRIHASSIDKSVQNGIVPAPIYAIAPARLLHTWTEVLFDGRWSSLEGCILDAGYLGQVQSLFPDATGSFCGFAVSVSDFRNPAVAWEGNDTHVQSTAVREDFGVFASPDELYASYGANVPGIRRFFFKHFVRKWMNRKVEAIRERSNSTGDHSLSCHSTCQGS